MKVAEGQARLHVFPAFQSLTLSTFPYVFFSDMIEEAPAPFLKKVLTLADDSSQFDPSFVFIFALNDQSVARKTIKKVIDSSIN